MASNVEGQQASQTPNEASGLLWVDCEMTGLNLTKDVIIEFAAIATDGDLNPYDEGVGWVIQTDKKLLDGMDEWSISESSKCHFFPADIANFWRQVYKSTWFRLTEQCLKSTHTLASVDSMALQYARKHIQQGRILLAGSSVHVDKAFLKKDLPLLSEQLHYRVLDVSTVKEICKRWYPNMKTMWKSQNESSHRALDDIKASIEELRRYRQAVFKDPKEVEGRGSSAAL